MDGWMMGGLLYCMCNGAPQNIWAQYLGLGPRKALIRPCLFIQTLALYKSYTYLLTYLLLQSIMSTCA